MAEQTGLLDFLNSPGGMGLLSAVGAGLAGARRGGTLNAIGSGLLGGVQGYAQGQGLQQQQMFNQQRQKLFDSQVAENDLQNKARQQALERQQRIDGALRDAFTPVAPIDANRVSGVVGPRPQALDVVGQRKPVDYQSLIAMGAPMDLVKGLAEAPNLGRAKVARTVEGQDAQGNKMTYQLDEFGQRVGDGVAGYTAPVQVDLGGRVQFVKPAAGVNLTKTMSPGERDASARGWANVGLQREQANRDAQSVTYQQDQDGNFVALPTKVQPGSMVRGLPVVSGPGMEPLKGASKLGEGQKKQISGIESLSSAVNAYTAAVDQWDNKKFVSPNERAKMGTLYNNMMLQAKEAYNLGVLNGPDYDILQSVIKDPTSPGSLLVSNETLKGQANTLRDMLQNNISSIRSPGNQSQQARPAQGGAKFLGFE